MASWHGQGTAFPGRCDHVAVTAIHNPMTPIQTLSSIVVALLSLVETLLKSTTRRNIETSKTEVSTPILPHCLPCGKKKIYIYIVKICELFSGRKNSVVTQKPLPVSKVGSCGSAPPFGAIANKSQRQTSPWHQKTCSQLEFEPSCSNLHNFAI